MTSELPSCTVRTLPPEHLIPAAATAVRLNPANRPAPGRLSSVLVGLPLPLAIAMVTTKYWGAGPVELTVGFMDTAASDVDLRARILSHMNAWGEYAAVRFRETRSDAQVRVTRGRPGYWSYIGTDVLHVPPGEPTMNLQGFTMETPEEEYRRVVRHETGHTLGFPHEHMRRAIVERIDPERAYAYFGATQGWSRSDVDHQVLTPLDERSLSSTPADEDSIMSYQIPGDVTLDGTPIRGGSDIDPTDGAFAAKVYPRGAVVPGPAGTDLDEVRSLLERAVALLESAR